MRLLHKGESLCCPDSYGRCCVSGAGVGCWLWRLVGMFAGYREPLGTVKRQSPVLVYYLCIVCLRGISQVMNEIRFCPYIILRGRAVVALWWHRGAAGVRDGRACRCRCAVVALRNGSLWGGGREVGAARTFRLESSPKLRGGCRLPVRVRAFVLVQHRLPSLWRAVWRVS